MIHKIETSQMFLVYKDENGEYHYQPWEDVQECGGLIDPDTGDDMELIGWVTELPSKNKDVETY